MTDVSIIIVSWNARGLLLKCLESIPRGLGGLKAEVIVVENASSDGSAEAVKKMFPGVRLLPQKENLGFAKANNIGIRESAGRYVCLINSDVVVLPGCIERLFLLLEERPTAAIAAPKVLNPDMTLQASCRRFPSLPGAMLSTLGLDRLNYFPHDRTRRVEAVSGCFMLARREAIDAVGPLDERFFFYAEDKDWCKRFHDARWDVYYHPDAKAIHYGGSSSSLAPVAFYVEMQKANIKYWRKHRGAPARTLYVMIVLLHQSMRLAASGARYALRPKHREHSAHKARRSAACLKWLITGAKAA
ncbi:MAG TPA: glycosyltransferase family 2 protein [Thermodesulfobacteriota bacterium]